MSKVLIIEDHELVSWALTKVVEKILNDPFIYSTGVYSDGIAFLKQNRVELIVVNLEISDKYSVELISEFRKIQSDVRIIIHSALPEKEYAVKYLTAGANGFLSKNSPVSVIEESFQVVLADKRYISSLAHEVIAEAFLKSINLTNQNEPDMYLTKRENEVIQLMLKGKWTKEIASELGLKVTTVSTHKSNIFEKFGVYNLIDLFRAVQQRMPELIKAS